MARIFEKKKVILNFPITSDYTEQINDLIAEEEIFSDEQIRKYILNRFFDQLLFFTLEERPQDLVSIEIENETMGLYEYVGDEGIFPVGELFWLLGFEEDDLGVLKRKDTGEIYKVKSEGEWADQWAYLNPDNFTGLYL